MKNEPGPLDDLAALTDPQTRRDLVASELSRLNDQYGSDRSQWPEGQVTLAQRYENALRKTDQGTLRRAQRDERNREVLRSGNYRVESGFGAGANLDAHTRGHSSNRPWQGLGTDVVRSDSPNGLMERALDAFEAMPEEIVPTEGRDRLARALDREKNPASSAYVIAASDPAYVSAFGKALQDPLFAHRMWTDEEALAYQRVQYARAALGESGSGTYLVPIPLDPTIVLTNASVIDPVRQLARVETTIGATWTGVKSAGSTANWKGENSAFTESNPALTQLTATPQMLTDWITASYELVMDSNVTAQLPQLINDAFANAEGAAWINGTGASNQPTGIITAISATIASTVTATTRGSFTSASGADVFALNNALNARSRKSPSTAWLASHKTINTIRTQGATYGAQFWAAMAEGQPSTLLGYPIFESSAMPTTTTTGTVLALFGDFSRFCVVDRVGAQVEYVSTVVDTNGLPTGTRGWTAYKRTTGFVEEISAFQFLLT